MAKRLLILTAVSALLIFAAVPTAAAGPRPQGGVIFGSDVRVESDETIDGDLVVFGGDIVVESGGRVEGDLVAIGGDITVSGEVEGDVVAVGGDLLLTFTAVVGGNVVSPFGEVEREEGAEVRGEVQEELVIGFRDFRLFQPRFFFRGFVADFFGTLLTILGLVALGVLAVALAPRPVDRVKTTLTASPGLSLGVGLLALIIVTPLSILLFVVCIGFLLLAALALVALFGWVAAGLLVGERLLEAAQAKDRSSVLAVTLGTLLITLIVQIPCLGFLFGLGIGSWGLGAVLLTRLGTMPYPSLPQAPQAAPKPPRATRPPSRR